LEIAENLCIFAVEIHAVKSAYLDRRRGIKEEDRI
jgi:hypothetical protein